jgi:hypothetical protein
MTNTTFKWNEANTEELIAFVGDESPISTATVEAAAEKIGTSPRSVGAKLRNLRYVVEKNSKVAVKTFSDEQAAELKEFLNNHNGEYTFAEVAEQFAGGAFTAKQIQGKVLSMELTGAVKASEKKTYERSYTEDEQALIVRMANAGKSLEDIANAVNRQIASVRGKALSLLRAGEIDAIPASQKAPKAEDPFSGVDVPNLTVDEIAEMVGRTPRGIKTMLTRRRLVAKDYDGATKADKAEAARAEA